MIKLGFVMIVAAAAVGCAGDDDGGGLSGTGPISMAKAEELCMTSCEFEDSCGTLSTDETVATCTSDCADNIGGGGYRQDAVQALVDCVTASCSADLNMCHTACVPTSAHESYETACRAKEAECGASQDSIDAACETTPSGIGDVGYFCLLTPTVVNAFAACFDMDCSAIGACFDMVAAQYDIPD